MTVETTSNEYIIKLSKDIFNPQELDIMLSELRLKEISASLEGTQGEASTIANEIDQNWWNANKTRFS
jgi:hypothetical protein